MSEQKANHDLVNVKAETSTAHGRSLHHKHGKLLMFSPEEKSESEIDSRAFETITEQPHHAQAHDHHSGEAHSKHHHHHHHHHHHYHQPHSDSNQTISKGELSQKSSSNTFKTNHPKYHPHHHHPHHHHHHQSTTDDLEDLESELSSQEDLPYPPPPMSAKKLLSINPATGKPYIFHETTHGNLINKVSMFLPGMQSIPRIYENNEDIPVQAQLIPSLMITKRSRVPDIMKGLHVLSYTEHLFIGSCFEMMPFFYDKPNRYEIIDSLGQRIYFGLETEGFWAFDSPARLRLFNISVVNFKGQEMFHIEGQPGCCQGASEVCIFRGNKFWGRVIQEMNCCSPRWEVLDEKCVTMYIIYGPSGSACLGTHVGPLSKFEFKIFKADNATQVGKFSTSWEGPVRDIYVTEASFGVSFPRELDVKDKALLLGGAFLIYFQYFEQGGGQPNSKTLYPHGRGYNRHGRCDVICKFALPILAIIVFISVCVITANLEKILPFDG